ncbi:MAG: heavy metal translocating P-type ATPase [Bryobacteraceae bacterium]
MPDAVTAPAIQPPTNPAKVEVPPAQEADHKRLSKETFIAALAAGGIAVYLVVRYSLHVPSAQAHWVLWAVLFFGGLPLVLDLARNVVKGQFGSDFLAGMSIVVSAFLGEYLAGSIVVLMLSGGTALEQYAMRRASAVLGALAKRMPSVVHRKHPDGSTEEIRLEDVQVDYRLVVFPHEICPADGIVTEGHGSMDESYLTGEPYQMSKTVGAEVLSGSVNGEAVLAVRVTRLPVDSRYAKIMRVMQEAENNRPHMRRLADRLGAWYTVIAVSIALAGWVVGNDPTRFLAVLVIATPCPLLLAIPVAIIGAISVAASRAIIIKNPAILEQIPLCRTMIFDKTGTLTYGRPALSEVLCAEGIDRTRAIALAASLEQYSKHPLAATILEAATKEGVALELVSSVTERPGHGLNGTVGQMLVEITGRKQVSHRSARMAEQLPPHAAGMECILLLNGEYAATLRLLDQPRRESRSFVRHLGPKHQVARVILLSGDREAEVRYLAGEVGIDEVLFGKSPEEKLAIVREEAARTPTLFLGDGINDAPSMQAATVGVAFGQNSDVTAEAADAVVMEASLGKVDELMHIGRRMRRIALQSAVGGMALSSVGMLLAAAGYLPPVAGAIAQEVIDVVAVLNALRVALPTNDLRDEGV